MSRLPWIVGGGAVALYWWTRNHASGSSSTRTPTLTTPLPGRWVWPVPQWNGRAPVISDGFNSPRPGRVRHGGVDIMFKRQATDRFIAGTPNGSRGFVMPDNLPALAAYDGDVWAAMKTPQGYAVVIDHRPLRVSTFYTHLDKLFVSPPGSDGSKQRVRAGQPIGIIGFSPKIRSGSNISTSSCGSVDRRTRWIRRASCARGASRPIPTLSWRVTRAVQTNVTVMSESIILPNTTRTTRYQLCEDAKPIEDGIWVWPLPRLSGDNPKVIAHLNDDRGGVDVGYERVNFEGLFVPVYAAQGGTVSYAQRTSSGCAISIEHGGRWCTHYAHLKDMFVVPTHPGRTKRARVRAGEVIGYAAADPIHIRFELWKWTNEDGFVPDITALRMQDWQVLPQFEKSGTQPTPPTERIAA